MSSAITKENAISEHSHPVVFNGGFACQITGAVTRGLHDAAQPLTVLQGSLEMALIGSRSAEDYKRSIKRAVDQSQKIVAAFDRLREIVNMPTCIGDVKNGSRFGMRGQTPESSDASKSRGCDV